MSPLVNLSVLSEKRCHAKGDDRSRKTERLLPQGSLPLTLTPLTVPLSPRKRGRWRRNPPPGPPANEETLKDVYERNKRIDTKDVPCVLSKPSLKLYFHTMVG